MQKLFYLILLSTLLLLTQCTSYDSSSSCTSIGVDTTMVVDSVTLPNPPIGNLYFNAFPSLTRTGSGKYIVGYQKGNGDARCCGVPVYRWTMDPRKGWSDSIVMEKDSMHNYRNCQVSAYGDTVYMTYFNEDLSDKTNFGQVFFRISTDDGVTWSQRSQVKTQTGGNTNQYLDTIATEGKVVRFKNKLILPVYALYEGDTGPAGFVISNSLDKWKTDTSVWITEPAQSAAGLTECNMITIGDSLVAFFRGNNDLTLYRASSFDGITWTPVLNVTPPVYAGAKPALYRLPDGRIILNYRANDLGSYGQLGISCNNGLSFNLVYQQQPVLEFYYGDISIGTKGGEIVNVYSLWTGAYTNNPSVATLYCAIYQLPPN
jgi:BNR repeat-like domain